MFQNEIVYLRRKAFDVKYAAVYFVAALDFRVIMTCWENLGEYFIINKIIYFYASMLT